MIDTSVTPPTGAHVFRLRGSTIELVVGDITLETTDAIVNPTDPLLSGAGLVNLAIQRVAGPELAAVCRAELRARRPARLDAGDVVVTSGFALPSRFVIHCVAPRYEHDPAAAEVALERCYVGALRAASALSLGSLAFPAVATGLLGYPAGEAATVALQTLRHELAARPCPARIRYVVFGPSMLDVYLRAAKLALS
jgi:O-acetyl-ADP-ribose deacetylase (regulator of RNase III)